LIKLSLKNLFLEKLSWKRVLIIVSILILLVVTGFLYAYFFINPYRGTIHTSTEQSLALDKTLTKEEALDDIDFVVKTIEKRHYSAIHGLSDAVNMQYQKEIEGITDETTVVELWRAIGRILHKLEDAHSQAYPASGYEKYVDVTYKMEEGKTFIQIQGTWFEVEKINGVNVKELYESAKEFTSYENIYYMEYLFTQRLKRPMFLSYYGAENTMEYQVEYRDKDILNVLELPILDMNKSTEEQPEFVRYEIDIQNNLGILTLDACIYDDTYMNTIKEFFQEVKEKDITNIAVDLRNNGGGNSMVANEFMKYLKVYYYRGFGSNIRYGPLELKNKPQVVKNEVYLDYAYDDSVYVLTSPKTFSSATMFSVYLQDNDLGKVIGEPSGNRPSAYGDVLSFQLPHSKLIFNTTYKYFIRPDATKDGEDAQMPDYLVPAEDALNQLRNLIKIN
jgi:hypothetical protein